MGVFKEGNIPAVVVKWYTRYFEGVVGISPCEFDSHLPHKETSSTGLVSFVFLQVSEFSFFYSTFAFHDMGPVILNYVVILSSAKNLPYVGLTSKHSLYWPRTGSESSMTLGFCGCLGQLTFK